MSSMTLDPSTALADKYRGNRQMLEAAVLGRSSDPSIDPYSALRALQKLNVADRYEQMQKAMQGQPNPPSIAQQTIAQATAARAPQPAAPAAPAAPPSGGLGGMPVPEETFNMAGGGLVAFADGGLSDVEFPTEYSPEDIAYGEEYGREFRERFSPEEYYAKRTKELEEMEEMGPEELEQQKGLAALQAAAALSQGDNLVRGLGAAGAAFGEAYGPALREARKEKRTLAQMQAEMEDARRREEAALYEKQRTATEQAFGRRIEKAKYDLDVAKAQATLQAQREQNAAALAAAAAKAPLPEDPSDFKYVYREQLEILYPEIKSEIENDPEYANLSPEEKTELAVRQAKELALDATSKVMGKQLTPEQIAIAQGKLGVSATAAIDDIVNQRMLTEYGDTLMRSTPEQRAALRNRLYTEESLKAGLVGATGAGRYPPGAVRIKQAAE